MAKIADLIKHLENLADPKHQEDYDNAGLITGQKEWEISGIMVSLDATEAVIQEAIAQNCNVVVAHHPIIFKGLKKINGYHYVEKSIIAAIKNDIAIYAIHTNLDNVLYNGVNQVLGQQLGLNEIKILRPKGPDGIIGSGAIGYLKSEMPPLTFMADVKEKLRLGHIRHTKLLQRPVKTVAICGGSGSFLIKDAIRAGAQAYISSDIKYHEFFEANDQIIILDIGHFESEQHTIKLLEAYITQKFTNFAVLCTSVLTNPIQYFA